MKRFVALFLSLVLALCAVSVMAEEKKETELGTSGVTLIIPGYVKGVLTDEDTDESQIAFYMKKGSSVDFDVYQWVKAEGETLEKYASEEAAECKATAEKQEFNSIPVWSYETTDKWEDKEYPIKVYILENGDLFVELVFWLDSKDDIKEVEDIMKTLAIKEAVKLSEGGKEIVLGTSGLKISTPVEFKKADLNEEDTDENMVAYYTNDESAFDFDVHQWAKADGETLEKYAADEAAEFKATPELKKINDLPVWVYEADEKYDGKDYHTVTAITESGDDFVELVFWLEGDDAAKTVSDIIETLTRVK